MPSSSPNFANQDLRNRFFQGQDLTDADFSGADIRGCNFNQATLIGANFERVRTGKSRRPILYLIARSGAVAVSVTLIGAFTSLVTGTEAGTVALAGTGVAAVAVTSADPGIISGVIAGAAAFVGCGGLITFLQGNILRGICLGLGSILVFGLAGSSFLQTVEEIENSTTTSFKDADLTNARFNNAMIQETNFSGAKINQANWQGARVTKCHLPADEAIFPSQH